MTSLATTTPNRLLLSDPLCNTFGTMARKIWNDLGLARSLGLNRGEETITDDFLLHVQAAHPAEVITFQFTKHEESFTGADWEWWLTNGRQWLGLLIQAKVLQPKANIYSSIKHEVRGRSQIDILLQQANLKGIPALYFLYNHTQRSFPQLTWNCISTAPEIEQLGCTVAYALAVKPLIKQGGVGISTLGPVSIPLRCLVCCKGFDGLSPSSLPSRAQGVVRYLAQLGAPNMAKVDLPTLRAEPPDYVRELISSPVDDRQRVIERVRSKVGSVGSLTVIKDRS